MQRIALLSRVWEPACGDGAISEVMIERGYQVRSTDLVDRGYGTAPVDFLAPRRVNYPTCNCVITNPPFTHILPFARRALEVADTKVAILGRLLWLEGMKRQEFFRTSGLARVHVFSKRINIARLGDPRWRDGDGGMVAFAWFVWQLGYTGKPTMGWV